jgi:colanic acid/amylovoran biosynthesis glycosyltransferase
VQTWSQFSNEQKEPHLVVIPSVIAARQGDDLFLDKKAVAGAEEYVKNWPGKVSYIFREGQKEDILFGDFFRTADLGFGVEMKREDEILESFLLNNASLILASGDNFEDFKLAEFARKRKIPLVYIIEYLLSTRLQIIAVSRSSLWQKFKSGMWTALKEIERRSVFRKAAALQANGAAAAEHYRSINQDTHRYFDTRLSRSMMATQDEVEKRTKRLLSGGPLRLAYSGRLEPLKGADHLIPIAAELAKRHLDFQLDIFGVGSLEGEIRAAISELGLSGQVNLRGSVDFESELVPFIKSEIDLFVCCHRQSDPSCTYLETFGCGVPIVAYSNLAFDGILPIAAAGWSVKPAQIVAISDEIARLDRDRGQIANASFAAVGFASKNDFESTFEGRIAHLISVLKRRNGNI